MFLQTYYFYFHTYFRQRYLRFLYFLMKVLWSRAPFQLNLILKETSPWCLGSAQPWFAALLHWKQEPNTLLYQIIVPLETCKHLITSVKYRKHIATQVLITLMVSFVHYVNVRSGLCNSIWTHICPPHEHKYLGDLIFKNVSESTCLTSWTSLPFCLSFFLFAYLFVNAVFILNF